ncbi:uncharacterized protein LOC109418631 isoform X1 [Aedes albopictus]|uniref:Adenylate kinase n=2 Tax=Aedes albopictus TaxID=7160 RepID=A0ABM2A4I9_AEDAL
MEVLAANPLIRDVNIFHTVHYPTEVMLYFEQHHIFEIFFDLMVLLDLKRPDDVRDFIASNIQKVADKYRRVNVVVECPQNSDMAKIAKVCSRIHGSPVISMKSPISKKRIEKLSHQMKRFGLDKTNMIFIGHPSDISHKLIQREFHLNKRFDLNHNLSSMKATETRTVLPIAVSLKNSMRQMALHPDHSRVKYIERILIMGRPGSGKHRQARLLANRLDLILVSATDLINAARCDKNLFKKTLEIGLEDNAHTSDLLATIIQKRLLEPDCLQFGWVLVDFPNTAEDVENLYHLLIAPKKVIELHTNSRLCWKRKLNQMRKNGAQIDDEVLQLKESVLQAEFDFYDMHYTAVEASLERQNCVILHVNGNNCTEEVHGEILTKLLKID